MRLTDYIYSFSRDPYLPHDTTNCARYTDRTEIETSEDKTKKKKTIGHEIALGFHVSLDMLE